MARIVAGTLRRAVRCLQFIEVVSQWLYRPCSGRHAERACYLSCLLLCILLLAGCGGGSGERLDTIYGRRSGMLASASVNGTAVFADMFSRAGHHVTSWRVLSPRLKKADCIVWFPDDFRPPEAPVINWLEEWLKAKPGRTLIYIGRDFDAETWYWKQIEQTVPAAEKPGVHKYVTDAEESYRSERKNHGDTTECKWFEIDWEAEHRKVDSLKGDDEWTSDIDPKKVAIELHSRMLLSEVFDYDELLRSGRDLLIGRQAIGGSELYIVANGSFLLNAMLVNHEHRKLAGKLIDAIGPAGKNVVFLESRPSMFSKEDRKKLRDAMRGKKPEKHSASAVYAGRANPDDEEYETSPPILKSDPEAGDSSGLEMADVWPTNWILLHFAAIGIIFCFWKLPVFGRPLAPESPEASDFGKHIDAVGDMLKRSGDMKYARSRIDHYQQVLKKSE